MPTILTNADLSFEQTFDLTTANGIFAMEDLTDYAGASIPLAGVKGVFSIVSPSGTTIYNNTTYANPGSDIIRNLSATNQITIPLPNLSNQSPETGEYEITYTVQINDGANPVYYITKTSTFDYTYVSPTVDINAQVDCLSPLINGTDETDYDVDGITPTITRTFVLQYPTGSGGVDITNTTSDYITTSTFYTGMQTFTVTSELEYTFDDGLIVLDEVTGTKGILVDCTFVCNIYCCLKTLNSEKNNALQINGPASPQYLALESQLEKIMVVLGMLKLAIQCGKQNDANAYLQSIQQMANCSDDCSCNDGTPRLVQGIGLQNVNVVVQDGGAPITVTSAVAGGITTYTVSFDQALVTKINNSYNTVVTNVDGTITVTPSGVINDVQTYTISANYPAAENRTEFLCLLSYANFAVPTLGATPTVSNVLYSGSNMTGTPTVVPTDLANPNWATMNNLFTVSGFQTAANNNYKVDVSVSIQGADFTLIGAPFGTFSAAQMKGLYDQLQPQILDKSSGSFKFRLVVGADSGVGQPLTNKYLVAYPDIRIMIKISQ